MSAADRILADLERAAADGRWICGVTEWAREGYCLSFAQRISIDLRGRRRIAIESRRCTQHPHRATVHEYRLTPIPKRLVFGSPEANAIVEKMHARERSEGLVW